MYQSIPSDNQGLNLVVMHQGKSKSLVSCRRGVSGTRHRKYVPAGRRLAEARAETVCRVSTGYEQPGAVDPLVIPLT